MKAPRDVRQVDHRPAPVSTYGRYAQRRLSESDGSPLDAAEPLVLSALQVCLDELLRDCEPVLLLDAGCGKRRPIPIADDCYVVGIDISECQLAGNPAIDEAIVGDVQSVQLEPSRFDAVVCWNVLEHLEDPERALLNFHAALRPGGVMILAVPHVLSIKGLVTRFTPFWFHRWVWRHLLDDAPEIEPFPTVLSFAITPRRLRTLARRHGLAVEFASEYEGWEQKKLRSRLRLTGRAFQALRLLISTVSLGTVTAGVTDAILVLRKRG
jgi:SAM-dependent methyltransferase